MQEITMSRAFSAVLAVASVATAAACLRGRGTAFNGNLEQSGQREALAGIINRFNKDPSNSRAEQDLIAACEKLALNLLKQEERKVKEIEKERESLPLEEQADFSKCFGADDRASLREEILSAFIHNIEPFSKQVFEKYESLVSGLLRQTVELQVKNMREGRGDETGDNFLKVAVLNQTANVLRNIAEKSYQPEREASASPGGGSSSGASSVGPDCFSPRSGPVRLFEDRHTGGQSEGTTSLEPSK